MSFDCACVVAPLRKLLAPRIERAPVKRRTCVVVNKPFLRISGRYEVGDLLGEGAFGKVSSVKGKECGRHCVVKVVDRSLVHDAAALEREVAIHAGLDHPNIVRVYETFADEAEVGIVLEPCKGGDLETLFEGRDPCSESETQYLFAQIMQAVYYMHCQGVAHRDLKPENFLIKEKGVPLSQCTVKLIDFGFSARFSPGAGDLRTICGTPHFMAPEVLSRRPYDEKCDVWSCGIILYFMLCGACPFDGEDLEEIFDAVRREPLRMYGFAWRGVSKEARSLVVLLLRRIPRTRLSAQQVLESPWLREAKRGSSPGALAVTPGMLENASRFGSLSAFEKVSLHRVAYNMEDAHVQEMRQAFLLLDTDGNGTIDREELIEGVGEMPAPVELIFETADVNKDGSVDYTEFLAAMMEPPETWPTSACMAAFRSFDTDHSGFISVKEISAVLQQDGSPCPLKCSAALKDLKRTLDEVDVDGDGELSFAEFMEMLRRVCARSKSDVRAGIGGA